MSLTSDELNSFHQFALAAIRDAENDATLEELLSKWRAAKERHETNDSIRQSLSEFESGQGRPVDQFMNEMKSKHQL